MGEKIEMIIVSVVLIMICLLSYGICTMDNISNNYGIKYNGDPEGWTWNMDQQINGTLPISNTSLTIYQEVIEPVVLITVNGNEIHNVDLDLYVVETQLNGMNVSVYDVLTGVYGNVVIETDGNKYDVVVIDDDIILKVIA